MSLFTCAEVYYGWDDVATPDDIDLLVRLDRTTHELYPALRELILLYDVVANNRSYEFVIGTADYVSVSPEKDDIISIELDPIHFKSEQQQMIDGLESVLETAFHKKDEKSRPDCKGRGAC